MEDETIDGATVGRIVQEAQGETATTSA
jgi:hypothetical protein